MVAAMQITKGYRQTELGIIPSDWGIFYITQLINDTNGIKIGPFGSQLKKELLTTSGYKVYGQENVYEKDMNLGNRYISKNHFKKLESCSLKSGDFIISMMGTIGKCMIVPFNYELGIIDSHLIRLRLNSDKLVPELLLHIFSSTILINQINRFSVGGIMDGLSSKIVKNISIPLPPTNAEQNAIANALNDVDSLITQLVKLVAKKRAIKQGAMHELLKPKEDWESKTIEEICIQNGIVRGPFGGALKKEFFKDSGFKVYEQKNAIYRDVGLGSYYIDENKFKELQRFEVKEGDFIISCSGTIGKIFQLPKKIEKSVINQALLKLTINRKNFSDSYFYHYFGWERFQDNIIDNTQGGAMKNLIGMSEFRKTIIHSPSGRRVQDQIAQTLSDMDAEIEALEKKLDKYRMIKQGMMQVLLTGKVRLM